jgi:hypothetical protein
MPIKPNETCGHKVLEVDVIDKVEHEDYRRFLPVCALLANARVRLLKGDRRGRGPNRIETFGLVRGVCAVVFLALSLLSCGHNLPPIAEADYAAKLVGRWYGTAGNAKELMSLDGNGHFACRVRPMGFIANTLSQGVTGTVRGTWSVTGATILLKITGAENETVENHRTTSTIVAFNEKTLVLKSDGGGTAAFQRLAAF